MDQSNSVMIQKLMQRKKSYERMMHINDDALSTEHRSPLGYLKDIHSRKNEGILLSAQRPVPLSRITKIEGASAKKSHGYFANEQSEQRRYVKTRLAQPHSINAQTLDVTGQRVVQTDKHLRAYKSNANLDNNV